MRYLAQTAAPNELNMGRLHLSCFDLNMGQFLHADHAHHQDNGRAVSDRHQNTRHTARHSKDRHEHNRRTRHRETQVSGHCSHSHIVIIVIADALMKNQIYWLVLFIHWLTKRRDERYVVRMEPLTTTRFGVDNKEERNLVLSDGICVTTSITSDLAIVR